MNFKERIRLILGYIRYLEESPYSTLGVNISLIKTLILSTHKANVLDSDVKYLLEKRYIRPWVGEYTVFYQWADYIVKITSDGIDFLEQEQLPPIKSQQINQFIQGQNVNVSGTGNAHQTNISNSFNEIYTLIEKQFANNVPLKEEIKKDIDEFQQEIHKGNFSRIKEIYEKLKKKVEFITPILQGIIVEAIKKWFGF